MDDEGGLLDGPGGEGLEEGPISRSVQETVLPLVGDSRLQFDRVEDAITEEVLDGQEEEEEEEVDLDGPAADEVSETMCSSSAATSSSLISEDREDDCSSDSDTLLPTRHGVRTQAESSKTSLFTSSARGNHRHGQASIAASYRPSKLIGFLSRLKPPETELSVDSGIADMNTHSETKGTSVLGSVMEESEAGAAASDRTQLVVSHTHRGYFNGLRRGRSAVPVVTHSRVPVNLLKKPSKATSDVCEL